MNALPFALILSCIFPSGKQIDVVVGEYATVEECQEELDFLASKRQGYKPPTHVISYACREKKD